MGLPRSTAEHHGRDHTHDHPHHGHTGGGSGHGHAHGADQCACRCRRRGFGDAVRLVSIGLTVAAVVKELRTPAPERTWNGIVAGFVPYDFRFPTCDRIRERVWNPEGAHLVSPHVFGVGWTLNVGKAVALVRSVTDR